MLTVGEKFPNFKLNAVVSLEKGKEFQEITESTHWGKWQVIFFWPMDFTFICPTEIAELERRTGGWVAALQLFNLATAGLAGGAVRGGVERGGRQRDRLRGHLRRAVRPRPGRRAVLRAQLRRLGRHRGSRAGAGGPRAC